ncbi:group II intron reverse transcriptase/maturase [Intestinibacter sp.]|uniref:group II intron reverse transcriptase/maturase n=1 Tax=Intestinibacter sp. TaxID=1965304 RepID=UPI003F18A125
MKKKKRKLRNNEYYYMQNIFDELYDKSKKNQNFKNLIEIISMPENILLAYRNIKKNAGSTTPGFDEKDIKFLANKSSNELIKYVQDRLQNYQPQEVKRVEIPKDNGKMRPLGIPTIGDRLIQQCVLQVLEPICEAKFYAHSYGFRPNRGTHHAIARSYSLINRNGLHYVVDVDIKDFFDNIDHGKLLKQIWTIGIKDKRLISIISKMLKAPVNGEIPTKGTPQGGILSPLLSNITLNELDWWIASQWEYMITKKQYSSGKYNEKGIKVQDNTSKYNALKRTNLKEMFIVRYADDFKIFCRDYKTAQIIYKAVTEWLKERLKLDISKEKSKVTNLRKNYTNFLGIKIKVVPKKNKMVIKSNVCDKAKERIIKQFKRLLKEIKHRPTLKNVCKYNSAVLGRHQYYKVVSMVSRDFKEIDYQVSRFRKHIVEKSGSYKGVITDLYINIYGNYEGKKQFIHKNILFPLSYVRTIAPINFSQQVCNYTAEGRKVIHNNLCKFEVSPYIMRYLLENPNPNQTAEFNDNRISLYVGQNGKCGVTGEYLQIGDMEVHHKQLKSKGGSDAYSNLIYLIKDIHKLIHYTDIEKIKNTINEYQLTEKQLLKVNKLRTLAGNFTI